VTFHKNALTIAAALVSLLALCGSASAAPAVDGQFPVPTFNTNSKLVAGPDGNIWLDITEDEFDVAKINPTSGAFEKFEIEEIDDPAGIAVGPEGKIWVTDTNKVASFSPSDPEGTDKKFTINDVTSGNPIVAGPDGQMWVAASEKLVHFSPADPENQESFFPVAGMAPKDIDVAGQLLVIADFGPRIVTMTTSGDQKDFVIGHKNNLDEQVGASQGVAGAPSGQIAYSDPGATPEGVGLITPPNPAQEFERDGDPFGVAYGSDGAFWVTLSGAEPTVLPGAERVTSTGEHTYLGGVKEKFVPRQIAPGPNNTMWMTAEKNELPNEYEVVRISGLEPPVVPISGGKPKAPDTKIGKGPKKVVKTKGKRAKVTFRFSSSTAGATFECALVTVKKGKGKKTPKPKFKGCKSPKKLSLKPGKYRFSVRAVLAGVADPSPATKAFKVVHVKG
jgi:streptogramin lyase